MLKSINLKQFVNYIRFKPININGYSINNKIGKLNSWYTKILKLDEVKLHQERVINLQEKLFVTQEKRREIGRKLAEIRQKSNQLHDEIHKVKRHEDLALFLKLMTEETELLKEETVIARTFQEFDQMERELFTAFTNAIRDSHETQRAQLEYTKYFGIVLSIAGSFLAFCYSTIRKDDLKQFIASQLKTNNEVNEIKQFIIEQLNNNMSTVKDIPTYNLHKDNIDSYNIQIWHVALGIAGLYIFLSFLK